MTHTSLAEWMDAERDSIIHGCTRCGLCLEVCPVFPLLGFSAENATEVQEGRLGVLSGKPPSEKIYDMIWACSRCARCKDVCPEDLNPYFMQFVLRREMVKMGRSSPESPPRKPPEPYSDPRILSQAPGRMDLSGASKSVDIVYFPGCNAVLRPHIVSLMLDIFDRLGVDYVALPGSYGEICCGSPHLTRGHAERAEEAARRLISAVSHFRPTKLLIKCPACMNRLENLFSRVIDFDFELQYISRFLNEHLDRTAFTRVVEKTATLHDSCSLGRGCGDYESVRKLLRAIPGIRLKEMEHTRENASCCYSAPTYGWRPDVGKQIRGRTLQDAMDSGAGILVTECGGCMRTLEAEVKTANLGDSLRVEDFLTLVAESMGVKDPR